MRHTFAIALTAVILSAQSIALHADDSGYHIRQWNYDATVHADHSIDIEERLEVSFTEPRHGIYHYLNSIYYDYHEWDGEQKMFTYELGISDIDVEGGEWMSEEVSTATNIRIGSPDILLSGDKTYTIRYRISYPDDRTDNYDQLFHTVMSDDVTSRTDSFTFSLRFDKPLPADVVNGGLNVTSGPIGSTGNVLNVRFNVSPTVISGHVTNIPSENAITLYARLPEGYFEGAPSVPSAPFFICLAVTHLLLLWIAYGLIVKRKRRKPSPVVTFYPPQGISSAEVGTIIDNSADISDLTSLIPWLARRGIIKITEIPDSKGRTGKHASIDLTLLQDPESADLPEYAVLFIKAIFGGKAEAGKTISISKLGDISDDMLKAQRALSKEFKKGERKLTYMDSASGWTLLVMVLACISMALSSRVRFFDVELLMMSIFTIFVPGLVLGMWSMNAAARAHIASWFSKWFRILFIAISGFICYGIWILTYEPQDNMMPVWGAQAIYLLGTIITLLAGRYNVDTDYRTEIMGELLGLREFIRKAEQPRLKMLVDEDPEYFYDILPYAMVFGLTDKWVKLFKDIETRQPKWYCSPTPHMASNALASNINDSISVMNRHIADHCVPPSSGSSGSGGIHSSGGFSGGGGGGGGTGSW